MGLLPSLLTITSGNTIMLLKIPETWQTPIIFVPRRAPQTAGHRLDFGLGPIGPYRALPIGPYRALYRALFRALFGCPIFPLCPALFSPLPCWACGGNSLRGLMDDEVLSPFLRPNKFTLGPVDLFVSFWTPKMSVLTTIGLLAIDFRNDRLKMNSNDRSIPRDYSRPFWQCEVERFDWFFSKYCHLFWFLCV